MNLIKYLVIIENKIYLVITDFYPLMTNVAKNMTVSFLGYALGTILRCRNGLANTKLYGMQIYLLCKCDNENMTALKAASIHTYFGESQKLTVVAPGMCHQ